MRALLLAGVCAGALAVAVPAATADHATAGCRFLAVADDQVSGDGVYQGVMYGAVVAPGDAAVSIRCELRLDGTAVSGTPSAGPSPGAAVTAGDISYPDSGADVEACAVYTTSHGTATSCRRAVSIPVPPCQALGSCDVVTFLLGTANELFVDAVDPRVCPVLAEQRPSAPPYVRTDEQGDLYVAGDLWWDCPPYAPPAA